MTPSDLIYHFFFSRFSVSCYSPRQAVSTYISRVMDVPNGQVATHALCPVFHVNLCVRKMGRLWGECFSPSTREYLFISAPRKFDHRFYDFLYKTNNRHRKTGIASGLFMKIMGNENKPLFVSLSTIRMRIYRFPLWGRLNVLCFMLMSSISEARYLQAFR